MKKLIFILLPLLLIFTGCGKSALVPASQRFCSITKGFNLISPGLIDRVGYLTYLKIGNLECASDITVTDPVNLTGELKVIGVVSWLSWNENKDGPVVFAAQVSSNNKDSLTAFGKTDLTGIDIHFGFTLYDLDLKTGKYYPSLSPDNNVLRGIIDVENGHMLYYMSPDSGVDVTDPVNFNFQLGIKPNDTVQKIMTASTPDKNSLKNWGGK